MLVVFSAVFLLWGGAAWGVAEGKRAGRYPLLLPFLGFFAAVILSIALADPYPWQTPLGKWRYYFMYFPLVFVFARYPKLPRQLTPYAVGAAIVLGGMACLQYFGMPWTAKFVGHGLSPVPGDPSHFQARGFFPHHTLFSSVLTPLFLFLLAGFLATGPKKGRTTYGVGMVFSAIALVLTFSRGSWLAAVAGTVTMLFFSLGKKAIVAVCGLAIVVAIASAAVPSFRDRAAKLQFSQNGDRIVLWESALRMFRERPATGKGFHSYGFYQSRYLTDQEKRDFGYVPAEVHNIYLDVLAGTGVVGLLGFLSLLFMAAKNCHSACLVRQPEDELSLLTALAAGLAILVNNLTDSHLYSTFGAVSGVFILAMGQAVYWRRVGMKR